MKTISHGKFKKQITKIIDRKVKILLIYFLLKKTKIKHFFKRIKYKIETTENAGQFFSRISMLFLCKFGS